MLIFGAKDESVELYLSGRQIGGDETIYIKIV